MWEAKQLAALGARVVHKEKMPMKMALGVLAVRILANGIGVLNRG